MNETYKLFKEYEKASKEKMKAFEIWRQCDKEDHFSRNTIKAFESFSLAADREHEAFTAYFEACKKENQQ